VIVTVSKDEVLIPGVVGCLELVGANVTTTDGPTCGADVELTNQEVDQAAEKLCEQERVLATLFLSCGECLEGVTRSNSPIS